MGSDIERKLRQIRQARGKNLAAIAGRAGIIAGYLSPARIRRACLGSAGW